jgi:hypothetical protein
VVAEPVTFSQEGSDAEGHVIVPAQRQGDGLRAAAIGNSTVIA